MSEMDSLGHSEEHVAEIHEIRSTQIHARVLAKPPLPTQEQVIGDRSALHRDERNRDKRAIEGIVKFCVEGKPPVADIAKERLRRYEGRLLGMIAATGQIPRQGPAYERLAELVGEGRQTTAMIEDVSRLPRIGLPGQGRDERIRNAARRRSGRSR